MENNKNEDKEKIVTPEQSQEKVSATPEELEKQIALLQAQLEASRSQTTVFTQNETAKLDKSALELGINNPEEVSAIKSEVAGIENQKQDVIASGTKEIEEIKNIQGNEIVEDISKVENVGEVKNQTEEAKEEEQNKLEAEKIEKDKQEKFDFLEGEFLKNKEETKQEYNIKEIAKNFENDLKIEEVNKILQGLPKEVILEMTRDSSNYKAINAVRDWKERIGGQIGKLSNERVNYYDDSNKKELVVLGTVPNNAKDYLNTVASASRFFSKEVTNKFTQDAVDAFVNKDKKEGVLGGRSLLYVFGEKSGTDIIKNLCESGYKDEAKKLLLESYKDESNLSVGNRKYSKLLFKLSQENFFSKEEVREILDKSGYLEEPKPKQTQEKSNWG